MLMSVSQARQVPLSRAADETYFLQGTVQQVHLDATNT